jgi:hypothetical protein
MQLTGGARLQQVERARLEGDIKEAQVTMAWKQRELDALLGQIQVANNGNLAEFWINSPKEGLPRGHQWTVLNSDFRETLTDRVVKPSDPLLRLGDKDGDWEVELKIPQKHVGQVLWAFQQNGNQELDVDILARSEPTHVYKGKLKRIKLAGEATPNKDDNNESEPVVLAYIRLVGDDIPDSSTLPKNAPWLLVTGTEVHAKVRCGNHPMGYSLFYGIWEFFYEKVVFFF